MKDRPCAIILVAATEDGEDRVLVLPVTHTPPLEPTEAVEIPAVTKKRLGLDEMRSWIVLTELNEFIWPGPDLRPLPGKGADSVAFGFLPPGLFKIVRERFLATHKAKRLSRVPRTK